MVLRGKPVGEQGAADRWAALRPLQLCFNFYTRSLYSNARDVYKQHKRVK